MIVWQVEWIVRRVYFENDCHRPGEWACLQGSPQKDVKTYICECVCVGESIPGLSTVNPQATSLKQILGWHSRPLPCRVPLLLTFPSVPEDCSQPFPWLGVYCYPLARPDPEEVKVR